MDKNSVIGLVLIAVILIVYSIVFQNPEEPEVIDLESPTVEQVDPANVPQELQATEGQPTLDTTALASQFGIYASAMSGAEKTFEITTDKAKYTFTNKGGRIQKVVLNEDSYVTFDGKPLVLFDENTSQQAINLPTTNGNINLSDLYFTTSNSSRTILGQDSVTVKFVADLGNGNALEQTYIIKSDKYDVDYQVKANGLRNSIIGNEMTIAWSMAMQRYEKNLDDSRNKTTVRYYTLAEDSDNLSATTQDPQTEVIAEGVKWLSFSQKFFNSGIISEKGFTQATIGTTPGLDSTVVKSGLMELSTPISEVMIGANFTYYYGPNSYKGLKKVTEGYEDNVYMGYKLVSWVNKYIIVELFGFLEKYIGNYGVIIMIIVLIVKLALFPLSRKSYLSMAKMKALKPELDALKEKVGGDQQKMQQEQMQLYRQVGVNPISGCIPLVLQMPILFAMFFFFPNSIELRQESFLWANDLSTYDVLINLPFTIPFYGAHVSGFTLLMTLSTLLYTWSNNQVSSVQGPMKSIGYFMPIIFMFVLNSYSSGLSFYYFVSNIITFSQQTLIRRFVDEDKIRATLQENKKKNANKKKSKFALRLEEAMKASQEAQKQKQLQNKKKK
ncbi:membrane protein insertase YidC [Roseivirga misakiensis]|uniref:Membrane protein insertase YidC n=1 Tax=Roseivirga misakiensis TaxID=1563681 RepID=A0A1E5T1D3_9BACT|nr:membrane protein insertase YidC [Roseivirga misakiensis]OEK05180.1 membrane protein insertase YidC [Roseivirga misakiensis]